jgi:hypothetical protein
VEEIYVEMTEDEASVFIEYCPDASNPETFSWSVIIRTLVAGNIVNLFVAFSPSSPDTIEITYEQDTCFTGSCNGSCFGYPCSGSYGTFPVGGSAYAKSVTISLNIQPDVTNTGFSYAFSDGFTQVTSPGIGQYYQLISCG